MVEAAKAFVHHRQPLDIHFWRDRMGNEVDLLLARGEALYPLEIRSGQTVSIDAFATLAKWSACTAVTNPIGAAE
ncbi:MAG: hypothetical protein GKR89_21400 [Candidatus Latescibacteria bacterium]|nr:hypothetical protein [Candidatus Latescibacterota bacterium]